MDNRYMDRTVRCKFEGYVTAFGLCKVYARLEGGGKEYEATIPMTKIPQRDRRRARRVGAIFTIEDGKIKFSRRRWTQREVDQINEWADMMAAKLRPKGEAKS